MKRILLFTLFSAFFFLSCEKQLLQAEIDLNAILEYIDENNLDATEHSSGLYYIVNDAGSGEETPGPSSQVEVKYKGYFTDGQIFDQSPGDNTVELRLANTITAWRIGIPLMPKGSNYTFIVPSSLGYGFFGSPDGRIPPNTILLFDVELINFSQ